VPELDDREQLVLVRNSLDFRSLVRGGQAAKVGIGSPSAMSSCCSVADG
jgi:hypothetical protein